MHIAMIAAMANNRVIGKNNKMPWHLSEDLQHFKAKTLGKPIIMGRKTFESIGCPLPGRKNIVISRNQDYSVEGAVCVTSFERALRWIKSAMPDCNEVVVIGGGQLYQEVLPLAEKLYLTEINLDVEGDTHFPNWNDGNWQITETFKGISANKIEYRFLEAQKRK